MPLDIEAYLRVVRVHMDALGETLEQALSSVPAEVRDAVAASIRVEQAQPTRQAIALSRTGGPRPWFRDYDPSGGYYWRRLRTYLLDSLGRPEPTVRSLDDATDTVLSYLEDPRQAGPGLFRVQGLVVGYVQSGKTANFSALVTKAADLGYKLVIVLSGIHNILRQQTQRRLEQELGLREDSGVGLPEAGRRWVRLTGPELEADFQPGTVSASVLQGNERVLLVVKKNASVLRRLVQWMGHAAPPELPVLVIDDEADQASINTGGNRAPESSDDPAERELEEETRPSTINALIRQLLASFGRVSYVAYTATPFANVFIDHEAVDREVQDDLYPRDFIVALPRPAGYIGAEELFGRDALGGETGDREGLDVIEYVDPTHVIQLVPDRGEASDFVPTIPQSLEEAVLDFILASAALQHRKGDHPSAMLVHVQYRTGVQNDLAELLQEHVRRLRRQARYDRRSIYPMLAERWESHFRPLTRRTKPAYDVPFSDIEGALEQLFKHELPVIAVNSAQAPEVTSGEEVPYYTDELLDYERNPNLRAILVGGNRLSRGLTIEGLLTSYFVRESPYFDTLLQMGRWFGYRESYIDLTRLWTTEELESWFRALALAEEDLRQEIALYEAEHRTPLEFGPRVRTHPAMDVTATNKMGSAQPVQQSFAGSLVQTILFRFDKAWLEPNLEATRRFLASLGAPRAVERGNVTWAGIEAASVLGFLDAYQTLPSARSVNTAFIQRYIRDQNQRGELVRWYVSVRGAFRASPLGDDDLGIHNHRVHTIGRTRLDENSVGVLVTGATSGDDKGDELVGLSAEQVQQARDLVRTTPGLKYGKALRAVRDPAEGLLLVYPISRYSEPEPGSTRRRLFNEPDRDGTTVIGLALVFPSSRSAAAVTYLVGSAGEHPAR